MSEHSGRLQSRLGLGVRARLEAVGGAELNVVVAAARAAGTRIQTAWVTESARSCSYYSSSQVQLQQAAASTFSLYKFSCSKFGVPVYLCVFQICFWKANQRIHRRGQDANIV